MIKVIGCGNILRRDDGIGIYVIDELRKYSLPEEVELVDAGTLGIDILPYLEGARKVILVDAVKSQNKPGIIHRIIGDEIYDDSLSFISSHEMKWEHTFALGKEILKDFFPREVIVYGIEIESIEPGIGLNTPVEESLPRIVHMIRKEWGGGEL